MASVPSILFVSLLSGGVSLAGITPVIGDDPKVQIAGDLAASASGDGSSGQIPAAAAEVSRFGVPSADSVRKAVHDICAANKHELMTTRKKDILGIIDRLREQATRNGDPLTIFALYTEAENLAVKIDDPLSMLATVELRCAAFNCGDLAVAKKEALARLGHPAARAMIQLYDHPHDPRANAIAGRYYAYELQRWDLAFPLLAQGNNAPLKAIAQLELANPTTPEQMAALAEAWYVQAKLVPDATRDPAYVRTLLWYQRAVDGLDGAAKKLASKRILEVSSLVIQEGITDWKHLSPGQWARLRGTVMTIAVTSARTEIPFEMIPVGAYRVVPDPTATWTVEGPGGSVTCDWHGDAGKHFGALNAGQLAMLCGTNGAIPLDLITDSSQPLALCATVTATPIGVAAAAPAAPISPHAADIKACGGGGHSGSPDTVPGVGSIRVKLVAMDSYIH
jgi:hypothetical protein